MESWSQTPIKDFKVSFFLDTNILCYLVDSTYPNLNKFINYLGNNPFSDVISSDYVLLEFIGIRKREHYLRAVLKKGEQDGQSVNLSSLLKFHNQYSAPEVDFISIIPQIKESVDHDEEEITTQYNIDFNCKFHIDLFEPTKNICLVSKISKEDSLVLISAVSPIRNNYNENCILLTNDADFNSWYEQAKDKIDNVFTEKSMPKPHLKHIKSAQLFDKQFNFTDNKLDITLLEVYANKCILSLLKNRLKDFYIGKSFTPYGACPPQTFAFKAEKGVYLHNQKYVTIIGKDLNFILTTNKQIDFWHKNAKIDDQGILVSVRNQIYSFIFPLSADILPDDIDAIFHLIQTEGHFVFYHPDSL